MLSARPFISYVREDAGTAIRLRRDLIAVGATPWMDQFDLLGGADWSIAIRRALRDSSHVIILISHHSTSKRGFFQKEVREALAILEELPPETIFLIPVRLDHSIPAHDRLLQLHWIDLFPLYQGGFKQILASLGIADANAESDRRFGAITPASSERLPLVNNPDRSPLRAIEAPNTICARCGRPFAAAGFSGQCPYCHYAQYT